MLALLYLVYLHFTKESMVEHGEMVAFLCVVDIVFIVVTIIAGDIAALQLQINELQLQVTPIP